MTRLMLAMTGAAAIAVYAGTALGASSTLDFSVLDQTQAASGSNLLTHGEVVSTSTNGDTWVGSPVVGTPYSAAPKTVGDGNYQFSLQNGVRIGVSSRNAGNSDNQAVIFDSRQTSTEDWDLEDHNISNDGRSDEGFRANSPSGSIQNRYTTGPGADPVGNMLILQETEDSNDVPNPDCTSGFCNNPDDIGDRPSGFFYFEFDEDVIVESMDFVDIQTGEGALVYFFDENNILSESDLDTLYAQGIQNESNLNDLQGLIGAGETFTPILDYTYSAYGTVSGVSEKFNVSDSDGAAVGTHTYDNKWTQMVFNSTASARGMLVVLGGSGGIAEFTLKTTNGGGCTYNCTPVAEPASMTLMASGLVALAAFNRRRRRKALGSEVTLEKTS